MKCLLVVLAALLFLIPVVAQAATYTVPKDEPVSELAQQVGMYVPDLRAKNKGLTGTMVRKGQVVHFVSTKDKKGDSEHRKK